MFPHLTEAVINTVGMKEDLCRNSNMSDSWEMLTVVKMRKDWNKSNFIKRTCEAVYLTLGTLVDLKYTPECTDTILVEDFQRFNLCGGSIGAKAGNETVKGNLKGSIDTVDTMSTVTLNSEEVKMDDIFEKFDNREVHERFLKHLTLKKHQKLTFVKQRVYNTGPVEVFSRAAKGGSVGARFHKWFSADLKATKTNVEKFIVPGNKIFAFGLQDFDITDGRLEISRTRYEFAKNVEKTVTISYILTKDGEMVETREEDTPAWIPITGQFILHYLWSEEELLKSLANLPESTRRDLLEKLVQIVEDREVLTLLEDALYQRRYGEDDRPDSELVNAFTDAADASAVTDAAHLLVQALDALPDHLPSVFVTCPPETLSILSCMMDNLRDDGKIQLPESLQDEGELRWVAEFICSTRNLEDMKMEWDGLYMSPEDLLKVFYISVKGIRLMQPEEHP